MGEHGSAPHALGEGAGEGAVHGCASGHGASGQRFGRFSHDEPMADLAVGVIGGIGLAKKSRVS